MKATTRTTPISAEEALGNLRRAMAADDGDESWADDLPDDDLPEGEEDTVATLVKKKSNPNQK